MNSKHTVYALAAMTALAFGLGVSFWRSAAENSRLVHANRIAEMAQLASQDEAKSLRDKLRRAEAGQTVAETAERTARDKLARETAARVAADASRDEAMNALKTADAKLAAEASARRSAEGALFTAFDQVRVLSTRLSEVLSHSEAAGENKTGLEPAAKTPDAKSEGAAAEKQEPAERGAETTPAKGEETGRLATVAPSSDASETRLLNAQQPMQQALAVQ